LICLLDRNHEGQCLHSSYGWDLRVTEVNIYKNSREIAVEGIMDDCVPSWFWELLQSLCTAVLHRPLMSSDSGEFERTEEWKYLPVSCGALGKYGLLCNRSIQRKRKSGERKANSKHHWARTI